MEQVILTAPNNQKYTITWPTVDQFLQIESTKTSLAAGQYGALVRAQTRTASLALDLIDAFATFYTLSPEMVKDKFIPADINEVTPQKMGQIMIMYKTQYWPWFDGILKEIETAVGAAQTKLRDAEEALTAAKD